MQANTSKNAGIYYGAFLRRITQGINELRTIPKRRRSINRKRPNKGEEKRLRPSKSPWRRLERRRHLQPGELRSYRLFGTSSQARSAGNYGTAQELAPDALAQLGGRFFMISMSLKTLLARAPWDLTHWAIVSIPSLSEVAFRSPKIR